MYESTVCPHCGDLSEVDLTDVDLNDEDGEIEVVCDDCDKKFTISWKITVLIRCD